MKYCVYASPIGDLLLTGDGAASKRDGGYFGMGGDWRAHIGSGAVNNIEDTSRQAGFSCDLAKQKR